jgi:uncharacterized protein
VKHKSIIAELRIKMRECETIVTPVLGTFLETQTSVFISTSDQMGWPYIQHRRGPAGFLRLLDKQTVGIAYFASNHADITLTNITENQQIHVLVLDYAKRFGFRIWGYARTVDNDEKLLARMMPKGGKIRAGHVILISVTAWVAHCEPQIPVRLEANDIAAILAERDHCGQSLETRLAGRRGFKEQVPASLHSNIPKLQRVLNYIETHIQDEITVEALAATASLSQFHFARTFKTATGMSPYQYVKERRLMLAKSLLSGRGRAITEIAESCGFSSQANFSRAFRHATGVTPGRYREGQPEYGPRGN